MIKNESCEHEYSRNKSVDNNVWDVHDDCGLYEFLTSEEGVSLFSSSPLAHSLSEDDNDDIDYNHINILLSTPSVPDRETVEYKSEVGLPTFDVSSLYHHQMAETTFLKPKPIPTFRLVDAEMKIQKDHKEQMSQNLSTSFTGPDNAFNFYASSKSSDEYRKYDDSFSCTTNVTIDDIDVHPFRMDATKKSICNDTAKFMDYMSVDDLPSPCSNNVMTEDTGLPLLSEQKTNNKRCTPVVDNSRLIHHEDNDEQIFTHYLKALTEFKVIHGHSRVPRENMYLHRWCEHIRKTYGYMCSGKLESKSRSFKAITDIQYQQLQDIGFEFFSGGKTPKSFKERRLKSLNEFRSKYGHCKVPKRYKEDKSLGPWCCEMRHSYKLIKEGKKPRSILTMDMYEDLESLGFAWTV